MNKTTNIGALPVYAPKQNGTFEAHHAPTGITLEGYRNLPALYRDMAGAIYAHMQEKLEAADALADRRQREADRHPLTGLWNAKGLERRTKGREWGTYVAIDLDNFKSAQDQHEDGHTYGDRVLVAFADFLLNNVRSCDIAAHLHGDEYAIWIDGGKGAAERIVELINKWSMDHVTATAAHDFTLDYADQALMVAKSAKRS